MNKKLEGDINATEIKTGQILNGSLKEIRRTSII